MLRKSKGNMYDWITHTWNPIKGRCYHDCSYCYMKKWGEQKPVRLDEKELKTDLGKDNFIFVGSSVDMFAEDIQDSWICDVLTTCRRFPVNRFLFQTKNPLRMWVFESMLPSNSSVCITVESDLWHEGFMGNTHTPMTRLHWLGAFQQYAKFITIEPIMKFSPLFAEFLLSSNPKQINIGADSGGNNLPEPSREEVLSLIRELEKFTTVKIKSNLKRIIGR